MSAHICNAVEHGIDAAEYRRLLACFDHLWESATSTGVQQEMQFLLAQIERYEAQTGERS